MYMFQNMLSVALKIISSYFIRKKKLFCVAKEPDHAWRLKCKGSFKNTEKVKFILIDQKLKHVGVLSPIH